MTVKPMRISETSITQFRGAVPEVPTFETVDTATLYEGDDKPFHITLKIAEVGRKSKNGLHYDAELVDSIERQIREGVGGIRGHLRPDEASTAFPTDDVLWIGVQRLGRDLWAKGYIPPGHTREDIRRKKAVGQGIGTSIFGMGNREAVKGGGYKLTSFQLEQLDLAPAKRAALELNSPVAITAEMEGNDMPEERNVTVTDVPQAVREQIIREAQVQASAERVSEMETRLSEAQARISELEVERTTATSRIAELEGQVAQRQTRIAELEQIAFDRSLSDIIAEQVATWNASTENAKHTRDALLKQLKRAVVLELGDKRDEPAIRETVQRVWDAEFKAIAESVVASLAGPAAVVSKPASNSGQTVGDDELNRLATRFIK